MSAALALLVLSVRVRMCRMIPNTAWVVLAGAEGLVGAVVGLLCLLIPRRPDVFHQGTLVDRQVHH